MMRHDCSKGDLGYMGLLSDLNLNINDFPGNPLSKPPPLLAQSKFAIKDELSTCIPYSFTLISLFHITFWISFLALGTNKNVGFPGKSFMFKFKSESNPIYPRSPLEQSCLIIYQIKSTHMDYLEVKGFWDPSTYSWEKGYITCVRNFGTHCMSAGCTGINNELEPACSIAPEIVRL